MRDFLVETVSDFLYLCSYLVNIYCLLEYDPNSVS